MSTSDNSHADAAQEPRPRKRRPGRVYYWRRLHELERLAEWHRDNGVVLDDARWLPVAAHAIGRATGDLGLEAVRNHLMVDATDDAIVSVVHAIEASGGIHATMPPDVAGRLVHLTCDARRELDIRTMAAVDETPAERREFVDVRKRERDRAGAASRRRAQGATPREQSLTAQEPWVREGVSRAIWYRRRSKNKAQAVSQAERAPKRAHLRG